MLSPRKIEIYKVGKAISSILGVTKRAIDDYFLTTKQVFLNKLN